MDIFAQLLQFTFDFNSIWTRFSLLFISCSVCQWVSGRRRNSRIRRNRIEIVQIDFFHVRPKTVHVDGESEMAKYACSAEIIAVVIQEQTRVSV